MSNGYLLAAAADIAAAHDIAAGFGLEVIDVASVGDPGPVAATLADAPNVGLVISSAAAGDERFTALLRLLADRLRSAQLILVDAQAREAFSFLPAAWPGMAFEEARNRAHALARGRGEEPPTHAAPLPPAEHPAPAPEEPASPQEEAPTLADDAPGAVDEAPVAASPQDDGDADGGGEAETGGEDATDTFGATAPDEPPPPPATILPEPPRQVQPAPAPAPQAPTAGAPPIRERGITNAGAATVQRSSAPADATAFAPKKLRRGTPELVRIVIHQPKDLQAVIKAARKIDPRTDAAPSGMKIGDVALGASVGVSLEVRGAACDGAPQRRTWQGDAIDFNFSVEPDADVKQAVFLARVFVDDAQIGVLAFTRPIGGEAKRPASVGDKVRLKRHKRVFLSYSSHDRPTVAAIATAYQAAGVQHFFDRTSLKSGEAWSPRLRGEIDKADLFHLCWSKSASASEWVEKEATHALTRRQRSNGKKPDITVQMLDGPPWAPHPTHLDSINFDDFVRAAIVGYARGDGEG